MILLSTNPAPAIGKFLDINRIIDKLTVSAIFDKPNKT